MCFGIICIKQLSIHLIYFKIFKIRAVIRVCRNIQLRKCLIPLIARNRMARIVSYIHDSETHKTSLTRKVAYNRPPWNLIGCGPTKNAYAENSNGIILKTFLQSYHPLEFFHFVLQ